MIERVNIGEKMHALIAKLSDRPGGGLNGIWFPEIRPECLDEWSPDYAIVDRAYWEPDSDYFDEEDFLTDLGLMLKEHFSGPDDVAVLFDSPTNRTFAVSTLVAVIRRGSQEIEVYRVQKEQS